MKALADDFNSRQRDIRIAELLAELRTQAAGLVRTQSTEHLYKLIGEVHDAARAIGLKNAAYILNWCYIRLLMDGNEFYAMPEFREILDHPFLHPDAKGRHIILSFFAVQELRRRTLPA